MENPIFWPLMAFIALSFFVGVYTSKFVHGSGKRFLICGKSMPFLVIGTTLAAQAIDGNATLGNTGLTFEGGFWSGMALPLGLGLSLFVVGRFLAAPLNRMDLITLPDFFYRRYGPKTELAASLITAVSFSILLAGNLAALGWILSVVAGWDYTFSLIFGSLVVFVYTIAGGLYAAIWTDFIQIYIAIAGFFLLAAWILLTQDWQGALASLPAAHTDLSGLTTLANGGLLNWSVIISLAFGNCMALDFMERVFAARSPGTARKACYYAGVITIVTGVTASFAGLVSHEVVGAISDNRMVLPTLTAAGHAPFWIGLLVMIGVVGASMSTCDGAILATSAVIARNIIQRWKTVKLDDHKLLTYTRIVAAPMTIGGTLFAWYRPEPGLLLVLAFDIVFAGCVVPLFMGVYWPKANPTGAMASILCGTAARILCAFTVPEELAGLDTLLPPVVSALVFFPACLLADGREPSRHHVVFETASTFGGEALQTEGD
ncbi:MAG: sodium:solute symporter family protein [Bryobacterales bacterium]